MKAKVRFFANDRFNACGDPELAEFLAREWCSPWIPWAGKRAQRYVQAFSKGPGCEMRLHFDLSWSEAGKHDFFLLTTKHVIRASPSVVAVNEDYAADQPVHHSNAYGAFKVRDRLFVDKIKPCENRIWSMEFCEGFIAREPLIDEMCVQFSGVRKSSVLHCRSHEVFTGWSSFYSGYWLAELAEDETTFIKKLDHGSDCIDTYGLYAAPESALEQVPDIFRMPWVYNASGDSAYAVRKRVMEYWFSKGIKKSFFLQPLLVAESEQHADYLKLWREMQTALSANPNNRIA